MPSVFSSLRPPPHDPDWAESLVGLNLAIPSNWWPAFRDDDTLNDGTIVSIDFSKPNECFYQVDVDGHIYSMPYRSVFLYTNEEHRHHHQYRLPHHPISNAEGEVFRVQRRQLRNLNAEYASSASTASTPSLAESNISDGDDGSNSDDGSSRISVGSLGDEEYNIYIRTDLADWTCLEDG